MRLVIGRALLILLGVIAVITGGRSVVSGLDAIVDVTTRPAIELDNNIRFVSAIWTALGVGLFSCVPDPRGNRSALRVLVWLVFAGGVGRLVAFGLHGVSATPYIAIAASELLAPFLLLLLPKT